MTIDEKLKAAAEDYALKHQFSDVEKVSPQEHFKIMKYACLSGWDACAAYQAEQIAAWPCQCEFVGRSAKLECQRCQILGQLA